MPDRLASESRYSHVDSVQPRSPGVDYGLKGEDGFDPSRYDFYNPADRSDAKAFVVRLNGASTAHAASDVSRRSSDPYEDETPPPLSPIEELDDDIGILTSHHGPSHVPPSSAKDGPFESGNDPGGYADQENVIPSLLERHSELLFSREHLQLILSDVTLSLRFAEFLRSYRPESVPILAYYLDSLKALKTIKYAESIINGLEPIPGHSFTADANSATMAWVVEDKAEQALDVLMKDDLPAFIAYVYVRTVDVALIDRVTGREASQSQGIADGLAEVFVLSDPARSDNPIIFTSEEFHRMTGYSRNEFLGRNCRILGGPKTSTFGISRFRSSLDAQREHCEVLLNYRRDGQPFVNLIMCVPLRDQSGRVRYYLGAQLDITAIVSEFTGLPSLKRLVQRHDSNYKLVTTSDEPQETLEQDELEQLSATLNPEELDKLVLLRQRRQFDRDQDTLHTDSERHVWQSKCASRNVNTISQLPGEGSAPPLGYYKSYLLVRPCPSLRILFASPDLQIPGILQSPLLSRIGGSARVRDDLVHALQVGRKVTAKVQWLSTTASKSQPRWIHCTPLLGLNDIIGVWMVILVDDEEDKAEFSHERVMPMPKSNTPSDSNHNNRTPSYKSDGRYVSASSTSSKSQGNRSRNEPEELAEKFPTTVKIGQSFSQYPPDGADQIHQPLTIRQGPKIAGKPYSVTSNSKGRISMDDGSSAGHERARPSSSSSTISSVQSILHPKAKTTAQSSANGHDRQKIPANVLHQPSADENDARPARPPVRRSYKSLSPYGVLFKD